MALLSLVSHQHPWVGIFPLSQWWYLLSLFYKAACKLNEMMSEKVLREHYIGEHFEKGSRELEPRKDAC